PNIWQTPISSTPDSKPGRDSGRGDVDITARIGMGGAGRDKKHDLASFGGPAIYHLFLLCHCIKRIFLKKSAVTAIVTARNSALSAIVSSPKMNERLGRPALCDFIGLSQVKPGQHNLYCYTQESIDGRHKVRWL
ncbi:hypothetical protein LLE67_19800, partial [Xanthomonas campestris]|uniref:hypothetical protein n=1 Tax=Xanthomonas campestris TaxID=339 RepID=UPI0031C1579C|nr:hypothetical protein [Xanthomonas campestris]